MDKPDTFRLGQATRWGQEHWDFAWNFMVLSEDSPLHMELWTAMCNAVDRLGGSPADWMKAMILELHKDD